MKMLFIYPPSRKLELGPNRYISEGAHTPPLGMLYLGKILEVNGYDVEVLDLNFEKINHEQFKQKISQSDVIGITLYSGPSLNISRDLCKKIREIDQKIPIVIGGPHCCYRPESALINHSADICVIREGENIILPVMEAIKGKRKLSEVPGIYYKESKVIKNNEPAKEIKELDSILFPARHLVDRYDYGYLSGIKLSKGKTTSILTSRGCPHKCGFCGLHYITPGYRVRTLENIKKEIDEIVDQGYETLIFVDDNFLQVKKRAEKIMDYIIEKDTGLRLWIEQARIDSAEIKLYKKMKKAGVDLIYFGIESGNQDILDYYNKRITIQQIEYAVKLSKEMGFIVSGSFIFGAPIETKEHLENTRKFAKKLALDCALFYSFDYMIGSPIWEEAVKNGKIKPDEYFLKSNKNRGLGNFTQEELSEYVNKAYRSFYFNPKLWYYQVIRAFKTGDFRLLKIGKNVLAP